MQIHSQKVKRNATNAAPEKITWATKENSFCPPAFVLVPVEIKFEGEGEDETRVEEEMGADLLIWKVALEDS